MLDILFVLFFIFGILLIYFTIELEGYWKITSCALGITIWVVLALSNMVIEIPYQIYNSSSGNIEFGIHNVTSPYSPYLVYLFNAVSALLLFWLIVLVFEYVYDWGLGKGR